MSTKGPDRMIGEQVGALRRTLFRALMRRLAPVTPRRFQQLLTLKVIAQKEVRTQGELVDRLLIDPPSVSRLVALLVKEGLLRRKKHGDDRRCVQLEITAAAEPIVAAYREAVAGMSRDARRHLGAREFDTLMRLMASTEELFAQEREEPVRKRIRARASGASSKRRRSR